MFGINLNIFKRTSKTVTTPPIQPIIAVDPRDKLIAAYNVHVTRYMHYRARFDAFNDEQSYTKFMHSALEIARLDRELNSQPVVQQMSLF